MKKIILTALLMLSTFTLQAQIETATIGGSSSSQDVPIKPNQEFNKTQFIYLGSEIGHSGKIKSFSFKQNGSNTTNLTNWKKWKVSLKETTNTQYSGTTKETGLTQVFDGDITKVGSGASTEFKVTLTQDFFYDHTKNLVIEIAEYETSSYSYNVYFKAENASNRGLKLNPTTGAVESAFNKIPAVDIVIDTGATPPTGASSTLTYCEGETVELTSQNTGDSYEWKKVGAPAVLATTKDYTVSNAITTAEDGDQYTLTITKNGCVSDVATITLEVKEKPTFTKVEAGADICGTGKAAYTITGTAGANVTYQIGSEAQTTATIGAGGTVTVSSINNVTANTTITVTKIEKDSCPVPVTATATVNVNTPPTFTSVTAGADICETGKAAYTITGTAGAVVTYQIGSEAQTTATIGAGGTVTVSSINNVTANTTITVTKIEKDSCPVVVTASNTATVNVNAKPIAIIKKK